MMQRAQLGKGTASSRHKHSDRALLPPPQTHSFAARQLGRLGAGASDRLSDSGRTATTVAGAVRTEEALWPCSHVPGIRARPAWLEGVRCEHRLPQPKPPPRCPLPRARPAGGDEASLLALMQHSAADLLRRLRPDNYAAFAELFTAAVLQVMVARIRVARFGV